MTGKCAKCVVVLLRTVKHVSDVSKTTNTSRVYWLIVLKQRTAEELDFEEEELQGENFASPVSLDDMRELRVAHFRAAICSETVQDSVSALGVLCEEGISSTSNTVVSGPELSAQETVTPSSVLHEEGNSCPEPSRVTRSPWCNVINSAPFTNLQ